MRILITKPELQGKQGGMTVAIEQVTSRLIKDENLQINYLEYTTRDKYIIYAANSSSTNRTFSTIQDAIRFDKPALVIGVGWHTWSEKVIRIAKGNQCKTIFWSHGVGAFTWYSSKPLLSVARICLRANQIINLFKILLHTDLLVTAYKRKRWHDTRSIDEVIASWLNVETTIIPNAIDTSHWAPLIEPSMPKPWVVSTGRMEWQKGMRKAFEIVQRTNRSNPNNCGLQWVVIHPGSTTMNNEIKAIRSLSAKNNGEKELLEKAGLKATERRNLLNQALCLLCWSDTEYQSLSVLEALSCGCPVISRPVGWLKHQSVPGVMIAKNEAQASACVIRMASDPNLRKKLAAAARKGILDKHRMEEVASKWEAVIKKLAEE